MKFRLDINYEKEPKALLNFCGKTIDVYPFLAEGTKNKINRTFDVEIDCNVPPKAFNELIPKEWKENKQLRKIIRKLPSHRITKQINKGAL